MVACAHALAPSAPRCAAARAGPLSPGVHTLINHAHNRTRCAHAQHRVHASNSWVPSKARLKHRGPCTSERAGHKAGQRAGHHQPVHWARCHTVAKRAAWEGAGAGEAKGDQGKMPSSNTLTNGRAKGQS